jgi:hypothetical protein
MRFDIPVYIEPQVQRFAAAQQISHDEALVQLIQAGLERMSPPVVSPLDILGAFSSLEESATADEALELAMRDRERRNARDAHA